MRYVVKLVSESKRYLPMLAVVALSLLLLTAVNLMSPELLSRLVKLLTEDFSASDMPRVSELALLLLSTYVGRALFRFLSNYLAHISAWNMVSQMRIKIYDHLQKLSLSYYTDKQTGQLMSRVINDTASFELLIAHVLPEVATSIITLIAVTVVLMFVNVRLTLLSFIPVPFIFVLSFYYAKKIRPYFTAAQARMADMNAVLQDNLSGIKEIQVFNQQDVEKQNFTKYAYSWSDAMIKALRFNGIYHPLVELVMSLATVIVVGFGGAMALNNLLSIADITKFLLYIAMFYAPIISLAQLVEQLQQALAGATRVYEVLDVEPDIVNKKGAKALKNSTGHVRFDDVCFDYDEDTHVLEHVSFDVPKGHMVALVGPTGVGKTTIASLIARFYDPTSGRVLLDDADIRAFTLESLRNQMSIVLQDVFLFNGTIAQNIAYGYKNCTIDEIISAAKIAHVHDYIASLPQGYDTQIGERGMRLSGGQKQRLAIARAVLRNAPILILDEATAAIDMETEAEIQKAIQELAGSRTLIVIAHRLSTVRRADNIVVLDDCKIVEQGKHEELVNAGGLYSRLCSSQIV